MNLVLTVLAVLALIFLLPAALIVLLRWGEWRRLRSDVVELAQSVGIMVVPALALLAAGLLWRMAQ